MENYKMSDAYYVEIVAYENDEVVKRMGPMSEWKADKVERGVNINLNHSEFFTRVGEG
jgi:hypothetical protein